MFSMKFYNLIMLCSSDRSRNFICEEMISKIEVITLMLFWKGDFVVA